MRTYYTNVRGNNGVTETGILVIGPLRPSFEEQIACVQLVARLVDKSWAVTANESTLIGRLAKKTAHVSGGGTLTWE